MPPRPTPPPDETSAVIAEDLRAVVGRLVRRLRTGYPVPPHQFSVLRSIERGGPQTTSRLAVTELVRPQSMAHTLHQLDQAGLITRCPDPSDGRQTLIDLSDRGRTVLDEQRREATGWLAAAIEETLSAEERDTLGDAVSLLHRLVES